MKYIFNLPILLLSLGGLVLTVGDIMMKKWVASHHSLYYWLGMSIYVIGLNFLAQSFKYKNIAVASVVFVLFNIITLALVSWFYFDERLTTNQIVGVVLGVAAIVFLEMA